MTAFLEIAARDVAIVALAAVAVADAVSNFRVAYFEQEIAEADGELSAATTRYKAALKGREWVLENWQQTAVILEQRRADEADCDLVEFAGIEFV